MAIYDIDITLHSDDWKNKNRKIEEFVTNIIEQVLDSLIEGIPHLEVSVVLADNKFLRELNLKYRGKDAPTNVLSFPITDAETLIAPTPFLSLGDIIIAYETIKQEAAEQNKSFKDHLAHMLVHGCLHLLHYDHINEEEAQEMEELEIDILENMGITNPYKD